MATTAVKPGSLAMSQLRRNRVRSRPGVTGVAGPVRHRGDRTPMVHGVGPPAVAPDAHDRWWDQLGAGFQLTSALHVLRGHELLVLGRRREFEAHLADMAARG